MSSNIEDLPNDTPEEIEAAIDHLPPEPVDTGTADELADIDSVENVRYTTREPDLVTTKIALITEDEIHGLTIGDDGWVHPITREGGPEEVLTPVLDHLIGRP